MVAPRAAQGAPATSVDDGESNRSDSLGGVTAVGQAPSVLSQPGPATSGSGRAG